MSHDFQTTLTELVYVYVFKKWSQGITDEDDAIATRIIEAMNDAGYSFRCENPKGTNIYRASFLGEIYGSALDLPTAIATAALEALAQTDNDLREELDGWSAKRALGATIHVETNDD